MSQNINPIILYDRIPNAKDFYWYEALRLPKWDVTVFPESNEVYENILNVTKRLQWIRDFYGQSVVITSWYRPEHYNRYLKDFHGYKVASRSSHRNGRGVDFRIYGSNSIDRVNQNKLELFPYLEDDLKCRICMNKNQSWIHLDIDGIGGFTY